MGERKRIGVMVPSTNTTCEADSVEVIDALEQRTGKPVVTSNQASAWVALRAVGATQPIRGFGRLLADLGAGAAAPAV